MEANWYCVLLDGAFLRGKCGNYIIKEIKKIFGKDFCDLVILENNLDEENFESLTENYIFINVRNYQSYINKLKKCDLISLVLPNYDRPSIVSYDEVKKFIKNTEVKVENKNIEVGSFVKVINNYCLENLYGVVVRTYKNKMNDVFFKLYTKQFIKRIDIKNLVCIDSYFKYVKFPVCQVKNVKELSKEIDIDVRKKLASKIRRGIHRTNTKVGKKLHKI